MPDFSTIHTASNPTDDTVELTRLREHLTPLLSVIAGMVDLIGFFTLGNMSLMEVVRKRHSLTGTELTRLKGSLRLLVGFLVGCLVAAAAVSVMADWAWALPVALAALAIAIW